MFKAALSSAGPERLEGDDRGSAPSLYLCDDRPCGKYVGLHDAYLSVAEALKHGGIANRADVNIRWIDAEELTPENLEGYLHDADGILVPGGFGQRGTEGKILAIEYARKIKFPILEFVWACSLPS